MTNSNVPRSEGEFPSDGMNAVMTSFRWFEESITQVADGLANDLECSGV